MHISGIWEAHLSRVSSPANHRSYMLKCGHWLEMSARQINYSQPNIAISTAYRVTKSRRTKNVVRPFFLV